MAVCLATGKEPLWISMVLWHMPLDSAQILSGNVEKKTFQDPSGRLFFVKKYHPVLQKKDPVLECLGQRIAVRAGFAAARTYLCQEDPFLLCSENILDEGERLLTLRSLKIEAKYPENIIDFFVQKLNDKKEILRMMMLDAIINNGGRHTGNIAVLIDAEGTYLGFAPLIDTVAFDNTRIMEAAKNHKKRWIQRTTGCSMSHLELKKILIRYMNTSEYQNTLSRILVATYHTLKEFFSYGLLSQEEYQYMLDVVVSSSADLQP